jgi:hypothetical protein
MTAENEYKQMIISVQRKLKAAGAEVPAYKIEMVIEAYDDHCIENMPDLDEGEFYEFVQDKILFDDSMPPLSKEQLEKLTDIHMEYLASKGVIPEDWNEDEDEDE